MTINPESKLSPARESWMCETPQPPSSPCLAPLCFSSLRHNQITFRKEMDTTLTPHLHPWEGDSGISCWEGKRRDHFQTVPHGESHPGWTSSSMAWFSLWETFWVRRQTSPSCCFSQDHSIPPFPCVLADCITGRRCSQAGSGAPWKEVLMGDRLGYQLSPQPLPNFLGWEFENSTFCVQMTGNYTTISMKSTK